MGGLTKSFPIRFETLLQGRERGTRNSCEEGEVYVERQRMDLTASGRQSKNYVALHLHTHACSEEKSRHLRAKKAIETILERNPYQEGGAKK